MFETNIGFFAALLQGLLSFFSPCVLPLAPAYFAFLAGTSLDQLTDKSQGEIRKRLIISTALFCAGFSFVFTVLGMTTSALGTLFLQHMAVIRIAGGVVVIILGLHVMGLFRIKALDVEKRYNFAERPASMAGMFVVGMAFAAGWTPCMGPFIMSVLMMAANEQNSRQILEKARRQLLQAGIAPECVEVRTLVRANGVAQDILDVCQTSQYDAVVIGRRGLSRMQELFTGSVTANLLAHSQWTPIWMVDGEVANPKILLASDGSPNALRAMDHLAFMFHGNLHAEVHVVHVLPKLQDLLALDLDKETLAATEAALGSSAQQRIDLFKSQAAAVMLKNGLKPDRLHVQTIESRFAIAGSIMDVAREGGFGAIVIGRSSAPKSLFVGSVARKIIQKTENMAVWWIP